MNRRQMYSAVICLTLILLFVTASFGMTSADKKNNHNQVPIGQYSKVKSGGAESKTDVATSAPGATQSLDPDAYSSSLSPGERIGTTTYDIQHNGRMGRQIDWYGTQQMHFIWTKQTDMIFGGNRGTGYEVWDPSSGNFLFEGSTSGGGCDIHPRLGLGSNYSGYGTLAVNNGIVCNSWGIICTCDLFCLDSTYLPQYGVWYCSWFGPKYYCSDSIWNGSRYICTDSLCYQHCDYGCINWGPSGSGGAVVANNHDDGPGLMSTVWFDYDVSNCYFTAYKYRIPDTTANYIWDPLGEYQYLWPSMECQVYGIDTITHLFAQQNKNGIESQYAVYFRRIGGPENGYWDYPPMIVDTINTISQTLTVSRTSGKAALVWSANYPEIVGSGESLNRNDQQTNDVFYMISTDAGATWGAKYNASQFDPSQSGWLAETDLSALIDTRDYLHIVWNAREYSPDNGGIFVHYYGSRLFHWDENSHLIRTIKDANWDVPADGCTGGAWNGMSIVKMQISECDGKLYCLFVQYNDITNGIVDDCHNSNWTNFKHSGTANGELYIAVSDNYGFSWDIARNLTNSYTPRCDSTPPEGTKECDSDMWPSISRYGMTTVGGTWTGVEIVDPSGSYSGNKFLDVIYVNDKYPGSCIHDAGVWTTNPVKWFRVPCVNPVPNPVLAFRPSEIGDPTWTKKGVQKDTIITLENIGNAAMTFSYITAAKITGITYDWLGVTGAPTSISHLTPNSADMHVLLNKGGAYTAAAAVGFDGIIEFAGNFLGSPDTLKIHLIIADTVQAPQIRAIRTAKKRLAINNAGNMGNNGALDSAMSFFNDCDTMNNRIGADDNARIYLYDASPFVMRIKGSDTIINSYFMNNDWLHGTGFRPLKKITVDSSNSAYQYAYTEQYLTSDSLIGVESWYWAPAAVDSSDFIIQKTKISNKSGSYIDRIYVGEMMDWDIPSDSGVENGSAFDATRNLMYCFGAEYMADIGIYAQGSRGNDCILADQRVGGFAFYKGFRLPAISSADTFTTFQGVMTLTNSDWTAPVGNYVPGQLWRKFQGFSGYEPWQSTQPSMEDSLYQDLGMVAIFGQYSLASYQSLGFIKILATGISGVNDLKTTIDKAKAWIANRKAVIEAFGCCIIPGDANNDGKLNLTDVSYIINKLYRSGPNFQCADQADANADGKINLSDISYIINKLYRGGPNCKCP